VLELLQDLLDLEENGDLYQKHFHETYLIQTLLFKEICTIEFFFLNLSVNIQEFFFLILKLEIKNITISIK